MYQHTLQPAYPHKPVQLLVKANAIAAMVRQLKVPAGFSAVLPCGPAAQTRPQGPFGTIDEGGAVRTRSIDEVGKDYVGLLRQVESEVCATRTYQQSVCVYCYVLIM